jgi:hypothetical protein
MAGYSGTPLAKKLNLKPGLSYWPIDAPGSLFTELGSLDQIHLCEDGPADVVHLFVVWRSELLAKVPSLIQRTSPTGCFWISWPKKASKKPTDLTEDVLRELILPTGWVDVKVCAIDAVWSALCFRRRRVQKDIIS